MSDRYILDADGEPVREPDILAWGRWFEGSADARRVARTWVGDADVSTVFLGMDHSFWGGRPLLFETMVFSVGDDDKCWRYATRAEAVAGHEAVVRWLRGEGGKPE